MCAGPDRQWERTLKGPQQLLVPASGVPAQPIALAVDPLETTWVRWNAEQDLAGGYGGNTPKPEDGMSLDALVVRDRSFRSTG